MVMPVGQIQAKAPLEVLLINQSLLQIEICALNPDRS
jgi:hypothetical protein